MFLVNPDDVKEYLDQAAFGHENLRILLHAALYTPLTTPNAPSLKQRFRVSAHWDDSLQETFRRHAAQKPDENRYIFKPDKITDNLVDQVRRILIYALKYPDVWENKWIDGFIGKKRTGIPKKLKRIKTMRDLTKFINHGAIVNHTEANEFLFGGSLSNLLEYGHLKTTERKSPRGFFWASHETNHAMHRIGKALSLCYSSLVGEYNRTPQRKKIWAYYSLITPQNRPLLTLQINLKSNTLVQCRAKSNTPPGRMLAQYVHALIRENNWDISENPAYTGMVKIGDDYIDLYDLPGGIFPGNLNLQYIPGHCEKPEFDAPEIIKGNLELSAPFFDFLENIKHVDGTITLCYQIDGISRTHKFDKLIEAQKFVRVYKRNLLPAQRQDLDQTALG